MECSVHHLRCEYKRNPDGIDVAQPRLSWIIASDVRGETQSAYQVLAASSQDRLAEDKGDLWDSGKVNSDQSIQIPYGGKPLTTGQRCWWKVRVWNGSGQPSKWSDPACWSMGLLESSDWKAEWIGLDGVPPPSSDSDAATPVSKPESIVISSAVYGVPGKPAKQVDLTMALRKCVAEGKTKAAASNDCAGTDPAPGELKTLEIEYSLDGTTRKASVPENATLDLIKGELDSPPRPRAGKRYLPAPYLRKAFRLAAPVKRATVYVTAQGVFELHINGRRVGDEYFMPGWTDYRRRIYYRTYDVTKMLTEGNNAIGAILGDGWFRGNISNIGQNRYGDRLRLKAQLHIEYTDGRSDIISTDGTWKGSHGPILESDMQAGETYDARLEQVGWDRADFDDKAWLPVNTGAQLNPILQAYPGVPVRRTQELATRTITEPVPVAVVFDLGQNFSGWIRLKIRGTAGDRIVMRFAEMLNADGTVYTANLRSARATDTYILKGAEEEVWEPHFTFHGFRYVQVTGIRGTPSTDMVTGIVIHSDAPLTGSFECSNPLLNRLYQNILWGQRSNYLEVPTDCPQRDERLGWTGDTQVFIRTGCYNQDVSAFFTKWIVDLMDTQHGSGSFGNQAPVFHGHGSPGWADAGVICPWTIYKVYGDTRIIETHYAAMARFIEFCGSKGLKGPGGGYGDWLAVGSSTPKELISAAYFAYSTSLMIDMANALGKQDDAAKYKQLFADICTEFQKRFVEADGTVAGNSQTAYCLALRYGLLTDLQREQAAEHLVERIKAKDYHLSVGFLGVPVLLPTLTEIGRSDLAYRLIQNTTYPSWGYSIEQGATTIWERWNSYTKKDGFGDARMNSFNHYAYGSCGEWMLRSMLGIETDGPGFKRITMKPQIDPSVSWAKGHYDSIRGRISSAWKVEDGAFLWNVSIPANTTATLYIPAAGVDAVTESGKPVAQAAGVKVLRVEGDRVVLSIASGAYGFRSEVGGIAK